MENGFGSPPLSRAYTSRDPTMYTGYNTDYSRDHRLNLDDYPLYKQRQYDDEIGRSEYDRKGSLDRSRFSRDEDEQDSCQDYPQDRPFINTDYRRDERKPVDTKPENKREALISAMKDLQDKIHNLELERSTAEENLKSLATDTHRYRDLLSHEPDLSRLSQVSERGPGNLTQQGQDIQCKLDTAEHRCNLLEKQLDYMRKVVTNAETDRTEAIRRTAIIEQQKTEADQSEVRNQLQKVSDLEREHIRLTATQTLAENKIRELEQKLKEEQHMRKQMYDKSAELETQAATNRILLEAGGKKPVKKMKKKKRKTVSQSAREPIRFQRGREPIDHYKLNLADIPFVAGKSTSQSHSLPANFQNLLSQMKLHNPKLCASPRQHARSGYQYLNHQVSTGSSGTSGVASSSSAKGRRNSSDSDLSALLLQLQDEFGNLTFEHQQINQQLTECIDERQREDLERELEHLVTRMEDKGDQIARLRRFQDSVAAKKKKKKSKKESSVETGASLGSGEVQVTTTIKAKPGKGAIILGPNANRATTSLSLYKDLRKIQTTLRKDDITWDE